MRGKKRILACLVAMLFSLSMCACGGYEGHNSSFSSCINSNESSVSSSASHPSHSHKFDPYESISDDLKGTTVRFATWENYDDPNYYGNQALETFYSRTGINAEYVSIASSGYVSRIKSMLASGNAPDVFLSGHDNPFPLTLDIAAPINKVSTVNLNEPIWDQSLMDMATIDGDVYLVNTIGSPWNKAKVLFYYKPIFEEYGIKTPSEYYEEGKWTWENFEKCVQAIKDAVPEFGGALISRDDFLSSCGYSLFKLNPSASYTSSKLIISDVDREFFATLRVYNELIDDGIIYDCGSLPFYEGLPNDEYILRIGTTESFKRNIISPREQNLDNFGYTYLPSFEEGSKSKVISEYIMYGIVDGAANMDAAGYFLRYWLDAENYDLTNHFIDNASGLFYYELTTVSAYDKGFNFDNQYAKILGYPSMNYFWSKYELPTGMTAPAHALIDSVNQAAADMNRKVYGRMYDLYEKYGDHPVRTD